MQTKERAKRPSADKTRKAIVKEARKLFAKKGFAATSISDIAGKAKINQSLIYHHFGSKEGLWIHVKMMMIEHFSEQQSMQLDDYNDEPSAKVFITHMFDFRFDMYDKNPELPRMLTWQRMEPAASKLVGPKHATVTALTNLIKRFQKEGQITKGYEAEEIVYFIFVQASVWFTDYQTINRKLSAEGKKIKKEYVKSLLLDATLKALLA